VSFAATLEGREGREFFVSGWFEVLQVDVDVFAAVTRDWDYMHNDPVWAEQKGPWGGTIAHGFYLLSLVSMFHREAGFPTLASEDEYVVNYGLDRVRFTEPVRVGDRIRARFRLLDVVERSPGRHLVRSAITYESERCGDRPHMVAESLMLCVHGEAFAKTR
jgi:acyl dehydratase